MAKDSIKIEGANPEEHQTWLHIYNTKEPQQLLHSKLWRTGYFKNGLDQMFQEPTVFENLSIPHWRIMPIDGKAPDNVFFDRLSKSIFNVNHYMRKWDERDYLPTRCRWHDSYGHLPYLYDEQYSNIMRTFGIIGNTIYRRYANNGILRDDMMTQLARLYWYTIEFGLIREEGQVKAFGAGIISSPGETIHAMLSNDGILKQESFDLNRVIDTDYVVDDYQTHYFVLNNLDQLDKALTSFYKGLI